MYERFTERARKVMALANQEAQRFNSIYIGTEHILLGLLKEGSGVAPNVLKNMGVDLQKVQAEVERRIEPGSEKVATARVPQTQQAKEVLEYAIEEARNLHHKYIGTEHLLLGLLHEQGCLAAKILTDLGLTIEQVREQVVRLLGVGMDVDIGHITVAGPSAPIDDSADEYVWCILYKFTGPTERATALYLACHAGRLRAWLRMADKRYEDTTLPQSMALVVFQPRITDAVISRIKRLAGMDPDRRDEPQEGAITNHDGQELLLLVTTVPTDAGEVVFIRRREP